MEEGSRETVDGTVENCWWLQGCTPDLAFTAYVRSPACYWGKGVYLVMAP